MSGGCDKFARPGGHVAARFSETRLVLQSTVPLLQCPVCGANSIEVDAIGVAHDDRIERGRLRCRACGDITSVTGKIWDAMGPHSWNKTPAQISNVIPPTPQLYERVWRKRSLSLLSGRPFPLSDELDELVAALRPAPGMVMVDVACSEGLYARTLADHGAVVFAVDHSRPFLRRVVQHAGDRPIVAVRAMAQHLPIASGALDASAMGGSLNEIGDQASAIGEMARVLRPTGAAFSMSLTSATTQRGRLLQRLLAPSGIVSPTVDATRALFTNAGLTITDQRLDRIVLRISARP